METVADRIDALPLGFKQLSDASFGVYLMHALVLRVVAALLLPTLSATMPGVLRVVVLWVVTAGATAAISVALVHTPILRRLVGRPQPQPRFRRMVEEVPPRPAPRPTAER